jgi:tetratricopeptide (TPR) repeat protein
LTTGRGSEEFDHTRGNDAYERVFRSYDIDLGRLKEAEATILASAIKPQLIAALDAWIPLRPNPPARRELADLADRLSGPDKFRSELRNALVGEGDANVRELAKRDLLALPPYVLFAVALELSNSQAYEAAAALLGPAQQRYPEDFGINLLLGYCLAKLPPSRLEQAIRFFTAAVALRPKDGLAHTNLGKALGDQGSPDEAVAEYRAAIQCDPQCVPAHFNLGHVLQDQRKLDEAVAEYKAAIKGDPQFAPAHNNLGLVLQDQGKLDEAVAEYTAAFQQDPKYAAPHNNLGAVLAEQGKLDAALAEYNAAIQQDPKFAEAHNGLGTALAEQGKLDAAVAEFHTANQLDSKLTAAHFNLGLALGWNGDFTGTLIEFKKCQALSAPTDALFSQAMDQGNQMVALLKAEYGLAAVLKGEAKPGSAVEAGNLALICLAKKQDAAAAHLYTDGFAAYPSLLQEKDSSRYYAARAAVLAGCGQGKDAGELTELERAQLRNQALGWLQADLKAWDLQAGSDKLQERQFAARQLRIWQCHVDFAGVRDEAELKKLPENEQALWRKLWMDVAALVDRAEKR